MAAGRLSAVVCTSSLDLGVDWGDVDLVINVGAPKGSSRLLQRIGRANHRMDEPSRGVLVPANRFEVIECRAALDAVAENAQDTPGARIGALDVLAQHVLGCACGEPFLGDELYAEVTSAAPYASLARADFDAVVDFVATGGYALKAYERFAKIRQGQDGLAREPPMIAQRYRMNVGTIVEADMLKVRLVRARASNMIPRGGRLLGEVEEYFIEMLTPGDTFVFAGEILKYEAIVLDEVYVSRATADEPKVPSYEGGKFRSRPISPTACARYLPTAISGARCRIRCASGWKSRTGARGCRAGVTSWSKPFRALTSTTSSATRSRGGLRIRPRHAAYTPARARAFAPLGFVANEYALAIWGLGDIALRIERGDVSLAALFDEDMLGDDLEAWLAESALMKRTFRTCAIIAGLIERRFRQGEVAPPGHDLDRSRLRRAAQAPARSRPARAARADAATGLLDIRRLGDMLARIRGRINHQPLDHVSPLAVPVMLEIGRESVYGEASEDLLAEAEAELVREAMA
jgi:ATP-dependent Lhr-like helicase